MWGAIEAGAAGFVLKDASAEGPDRRRPGGRRRRGMVRSGRCAARARSLQARRRSGGARRDAARPAFRARAPRPPANGAGCTNGEIAVTLHVAEATVKTHVGSIFAKLGVRDRAAAIVFAYDHGVVVPGAESE